MAKVTECILIVRDDFNNVLILQKKVKRGQEENFTMLNQKIRGKETEEKCINRSVKDSLKSIIFELEKVREYPLNEEESVGVYVGLLKERIVLDKAFKDYVWISKSKIESYNLLDFHKTVLNDYFS